MSRLRALLTIPLLAAPLALTPGVAHAAVGACAPAPATAVADALGIDQLHRSGLDGAGLKIGVISTSYDRYDTERFGTPATTAAVDIASGALPGEGNPCGYTQPVTVLQEGPANDDEGRAMLQIVHAIAPAAELMFTTGDDGTDDPVAGDQALGAAITDLVHAGVDVIVDDIMETGDLAFASGFAATAAQQATDAGVIYTVAAGNLNIVGEQFEIEGKTVPSAGYSIGSWQTDAFRGAPCPELITAYEPTKTLECLDFDPSDATDTQATYLVFPDSGLAPDQRVADGVLQWGDAPFAVTSRLSAYFIDDATKTVMTSDVITPDPASAFPIAQTTLFDGMATDQLVAVNLVIAREVTDDVEPLPVRFSFFDDNVPNVVVAAEYHQSNATDTVGSSLVGRAANLSSVTVAAASMLTEPRTLELYSGMGPQTRIFGEVAVPGVAPERLEVPQVRTGPTITGLDDIPTTFFGDADAGVYLYPGTSAATPVIGAALALAKQSAPHTANEALIDALTATATPITQTWNGTTPAQTSGAGLVDPVALVAAVRESPVPTPAPVPGQAAAPATLPATGSPAEGGALWALAALMLGVAALAVGRARSARRRAG